MELLLRLPPNITGRVTISRSFSFKLNVGQYESRDFFCAQKAECAAEDMDTISDALHTFCKRQVMASVRDYQDHAAAQFSANPPARRAS